jgi:hypothetical protein
MAGAPDDDLKQLHDALLRACEDYDADEAIRGLGSAAVAIIGSMYKDDPPEAHQAVVRLAGVMHAVLDDVLGPVGGTQ